MPIYILYTALLGAISAFDVVTHESLLRKLFYAMSRSLIHSLNAEEWCLLYSIKRRTGCVARFVDWLQSLLFFVLFFTLLKKNILSGQEFAN